MASSLYQTLARVLVYQVIFIGVYYSYTNLTKNANEFKDQFFNFERFVEQQWGFSLIKNFGFLEQLLANPELFYQIFLAKRLIFAVLGVFGWYLGAFGSIFEYLVAYFVHSNPLAEENLITWPFGIKIDLVLSIGVILAILVSTCSSSCEPCGESCNAENKKVGETEVRKAPNSGSNKKKHL
jgi:hypothetical protein